MPGRTADATTAAEIVRLLGLAPHPEGGHYRETFRDPGGHGDRSHATAIYYLLAAGEISHWHRVDAAEIWHFYAGAPLRLQTSSGTGRMIVTLGPDFASGHVPQAVVPADAWQSAESLGAWSLVGCTVSPGFHFAGFELAPPGWTPAEGDA
ncbi:cupin domain-containing protein [Propylenella binzhouense]|uniref:Cupin domain-containing protein n=1 Tax=Propylenella binzhouense TaxID=2555902 RepID=A0A964T781_9HYPH|nr:cupin domain-containing protein [Propylenella binzhouense]